ncbi:hypothetical protein Z043_114912 [Scleropages formosus]|uniref:Uncharacterized protein n=1 Tax=Scleropages formosus TaxID=113540 RepID=A0A0P7WSG3_SCLFO|nr:hypothetical protein Z043_114912 [Scleropages formosus]
MPWVWMAALNNCKYEASRPQWPSSPPRMALPWLRNSSSRLTKGRMPPRDFFVTCRTVRQLSGSAFSQELSRAHRRCSMGPSTARTQSHSPTHGTRCVTLLDVLIQLWGLFFCSGLLQEETETLSSCGDYKCSYMQHCVADGGELQPDTPHLLLEALATESRNPGSPVHTSAGTRSASQPAGLNRFTRSLPRPQAVNHLQDVGDVLAQALFEGLTDIFKPDELLCNSMQPALT